MNRRTLIKRAGLAGILAASAAPAVHAQTRVRWRLAASFPKSLDVMYGNPETFSRVLKTMSGGLFEVSIHAAGELMPAYSVVDGLQNGTVEMAFTGSHYFTGKDPAFTFGCTVPFGLTARQMTAWMEHGEGGKLLADFYAQYNIKNLCGGNTGTQMGGWYRKEMKTVDDFKGLKMRMGGGVFGEAMLKLGVVSQIVPIGEVYQSLEKGTLDAAEFVGPHDDQKLGLNKVAPYYYYPGWWEGGSELSYFINTRAWDALTPHDGQVRRLQPDCAQTTGRGQGAVARLLQRADRRGLPGRAGSDGRARRQIAHVQEDPRQHGQVPARPDSVGTHLGVSLQQLYGNGQAVA